MPIADNAVVPSAPNVLAERSARLRIASMLLRKRAICPVKLGCGRRTRIGGRGGFFRLSHPTLSQASGA